MSHDHPSAVGQAFEVIHEEMRRLRRENAEYRMRLNQTTAAFELAKTELNEYASRLDRLKKSYEQRTSNGVLQCSK